MALTTEAERTRSHARITRRSSSPRSSTTDHDFTSERALAACGTHGVEKHLADRTQRGLTATSRRAGKAPNLGDSLKTRSKPTDS